MKEVFNGECVISLVTANRIAKNNDNLQASFLNMPPICYWMIKQVAPPQPLAIG